MLSVLQQPYHSVFLVPPKDTLSPTNVNGKPIHSESYRVYAPRRQPDRSLLLSLKSYGRTGNADLHPIIEVYSRVVVVHTGVHAI